MRTDAAPTPLFPSLCRALYETAEWAAQEEEKTGHSDRTETLSCAPAFLRKVQVAPAVGMLLFLHAKFETLCISVRFVDSLVARTA